MLLTERHIDALHRSWQALRTDFSGFAGLFYRRLFTIAPYMKPLFPAQTRTRMLMLRTAMGGVVARLLQPERIAAAAHTLVRRAARLGLRRRDHPPIGEALLFALEARLGARLDARARDAWIIAHASFMRRMAEVEVAPTKTGGRGKGPVASDGSGVLALP
ncbi:MAG: hypothetical protein AAGI34_06435 [Pseudomonadota bacterium]